LFIYQRLKIHLAELLSIFEEYQMNIPAGTNMATRIFYMTANKATSKTQLFEVHIGGWNAKLDSLLRAEAGHDWGAQAEYEREIIQN